MTPGRRAGAAALLLPLLLAPLVLLGASGPSAAAVPADAHPATATPLNQANFVRDLYSGSGPQFTGFSGTVTAEPRGDSPADLVVRWGVSGDFILVFGAFTLQPGTYTDSMVAYIDGDQCGLGTTTVDQMASHPSGGVTVVDRVAFSFTCSNAYEQFTGTIAYGIVPSTTGYYLAGPGGLQGYGNGNYLNYLPGPGPAQIPGADYFNNAMAVTADGAGYWVAGADGGVFAFGDAGFHGSAADLHPNAPVVAMAVTPDQGGYWLATSDGGVFAFGDAGFYGSAGNLHLNAPVAGMASTPDGKGYWLVAADGGIFAYGDAGFHGSAGNLHLNAPVVGMAATPGGSGYWLVAADGGIFAYGDAGFYGSAGGLTLVSPIMGMVAVGGSGYWLAAYDSGVFAFGAAPFYGSSGGGTGPYVGAFAAA